MSKERLQSPVVGNEVVLRLFVYNGNHKQNVSAVNNVKIYYLDPTEKKESNPDGRVLVETIEAANVSHDGTGEYSVTVTLEDSQYVIGKYLDVWELVLEENQPASTVEQRWQIYPDLWYTSPEPIIYDFSFGFRPNRMRSGEKKHITVEIQPNVPNLSNMQRYYENLSVSGSVTLSMEMACVECMPEEEDLRLLIDKESVTLKNGYEGYYYLDTESLELEDGIYNIWFELEMGENKYISQKDPIEIFS